MSYYLVIAIFHTTYGFVVVIVWIIRGPLHKGGFLCYQ